MAQNVYEGLLILDPNRYGHDPDGISGQIPALIEKLGGEILVSRLWEERRLAYPIKGQRKGTYWLTYFRLDTNQLAEVKKQCQINDNLLRGLFLKVEPRIVERLGRACPLGPGRHYDRRGRGSPAVTVKVIAGVELDPEELNVSIDAVEEERVGWNNRSESVMASFNRVILGRQFNPRSGIALSSKRHGGRRYRTGRQRQAEKRQRRMGRGSHLCRCRPLGPHRRSGRRIPQQRIARADRRTIETRPLGK